MEAIIIPTDLFDSNEASLFRSPSYEGCVFIQDCTGGLQEQRHPIVCIDRDSVVSSVVLDSLGGGERGGGEGGEGIIKREGKGGRRGRGIH